MLLDTLRQHKFSKQGNNNVEQWMLQSPLTHQHEPIVVNKESKQSEQYSNCIPFGSVAIV